MRNLPGIEKVGLRLHKIVRRTIESEEGIGSRAERSGAERIEIREIE
jgi:hypothetical protein